MAQPSAQTRQQNQRLSRSRNNEALEPSTPLLTMFHFAACYENRLRRKTIKDVGDAPF